MNRDDIQHLVGTVPPGTVIEIVRIVVSGTVSTPLTSVPPAHAPSPLTEVTPGSYESIVEGVRRDHGDAGIKLRAWAEALNGVSARELRRAATDGRLRTHTKMIGRDHGATLAGPDAMLDYLSTRNAMRGR